VDRQNRRALAQQLALLFIVLAMGALHNLELPPDDHSAGEYLALSRDALEAGDFIINNTLAGVQTLVSGFDVQSSYTVYHGPLPLASRLSDA